MTQTYLDVTMDASRFVGARSVAVKVTVGKDYISTATLNLKANVVKAPSEVHEGAGEETPLGTNISSPNSSKGDRLVDYLNSEYLRDERPVNTHETDLSLRRENRTSQPICEISAREIQIPVEVARERREEMKELRLYVSEDQGKNWRLSATISPDKSAFQFLAPHDGEYWLAVQTVGKDGKVQPRNTDIMPDLKISIRVKN